MSCHVMHRRTFAQLVLHQLLEDLPAALPGAFSGVPWPWPSPWAACLDFFRSNPDMQRLEKRQGLTPALLSYDPQHAITPMAVFHSVRTPLQMCIQFGLYPLGDFARRATIGWTLV